MNQIEKVLELVQRNFQYAGKLIEYLESYANTNQDDEVVKTKQKIIKILRVLEKVELKELKKENKEHIAELSKFQKEQLAHLQILEKVLVKIPEKIPEKQIQEHVRDFLYSVHKEILKIEIDERG